MLFKVAGTRICSGKNPSSAFHIKLKWREAFSSLVSRFFLESKSVQQIFHCLVSQVNIRNGLIAGLIPFGPSIDRMPIAMVKVELFWILAPARDFVGLPRRPVTTRAQYRSFFRLHFFIPDKWRSRLLKKRGLNISEPFERKSWTTLSTVLDITVLSVQSGANSSSTRIRWTDADRKNHGQQQKNPPNMPWKISGAIVQSWTTLFFQKAVIIWHYRA